MAVDKDEGDNARLRYYIAPSQPRPRMPINVNSSGAVLVNGEIDYETANVFTFVVAATDLGSPPKSSTCKVGVATFCKYVRAFIPVKTD